MSKIPTGEPIRVSAHADGYRASRGFTEAEVGAAIRTSRWLPARNDRLEATKNYLFNAEWNGKRYVTKRVLPVFIEEANEIVVVTVYTFFF